MRSVPLLLIAVLGCDEPVERAASEPVGPAGWTAAERRLLASLRLDTTLPPSPTNPLADDPDAAAWGRALFYDPGLSPSGTVSCATCHDPAKHFTDGRPLSQGVGTTGRHAPTVEGSQAGPWFFWDGRADSLWAQADGPITHPDEMGSTPAHVVAHVRERWSAQAAALGAGPGVPETQAYVRVLQSIAAFERTVLPAEAPFDRYVDAVLAGEADGGGHLSDDAITGLRVFLGRGQCVSCHHGPMLTDHAFHNLGLPQPGALDMGRTLGAKQVLDSPWRCGGPHSPPDVDCDELRFLDPTFQDFQAAFKTPTLRNVAETAPYMHDGSMPDLDAVLSFYSELPGEPVVGHRELTLQPLQLTPDERMGLKALLASLSAPVRPEALPPAAADATPPSR